MIVYEVKHPNDPERTVKYQVRGNYKNDKQRRKGAGAFLGL